MNIKLELNINVVNTIIAVLKEIPYKLSEPIITDLTRQVLEQMKPQPVPDASEKANDA